MIKCHNCGWTGSADDLHPVQESRGEFWGTPSYEVMYYCPCCNSDDYDEYEDENKDENQ